MRVKKWHQTTVYTIQQAVWDTLNPWNSETSEWEQLEHKTDELVTFVARLFEMLVEKGVLSHQDALEMIEGYEEVTEGEGTR